MRLILSFAALAIGYCLLTMAPSAQAGSATLTWNAVNAGTNAVTYIIRAGNASQTYTLSQQTTNLTVTFTNLNFGPWYFAGFSKVNGVESDPSNEVIWTNRPPAPGISITASNSSQTVLLWLPMNGESVKTQAALSPDGPWHDWLAATRTGLPDVNQIGLRLDSDDPHRFFRIAP